jgi:hypothetical protein
MLSDLALIKKVVKDVEEGRTTFQQIYKVINEIEKKQIDIVSSDEEEDSMKKYIEPIQEMLRGYKKSIHKIKKQHSIIEENMMENK